MNADSTNDPQQRPLPPSPGQPASQQAMSGQQSPSAAGQQPQAAAGQQSTSAAGQQPQATAEQQSPSVTGQQPQAAPAADDIGPIQAKIKKSRGKLFVMLGIGILVFGVLGFLWWMYSQGREDTDDSYIDGHITRISSRVSGVVTSVLVDDNQIVKAGEPLVTLDPADYQARVDKFQAALNAAARRAGASKEKINQSKLSAEGQATQAQGSISSADADTEHARAALLAAMAEERKSESQVKEREAQVQFRQSDFERYKAVYANRAVTKQQFDQASAAKDVSQAQLKEAEDNLDQSKRKVIQAQADIKAATARELTSKGQLQSAVAAEKQASIDTSGYEGDVAAFEQAKSDLKEAQLNMSYTRISAPIAGRVGQRSVEVGARVDVGQSLLAIVQPDMWVTANFKETQLTKMKVGQEAEIKIDSFPGKKFKGRVDSFSPASGAKFSVLPADNASGNFTKVVQRVPVKVVFDKDSLGEYASRLAPGMSCVTSVEFK